MKATHVVAAIIKKNNHYLIAKRIYHYSQQNSWRKI